MKNRIIPEFLKKYWINYLWGAVFLFLGVYIAALSPKYMGIIIDLLKEPAIDRQQVFRYIGLIMLTALGTFATRFIWRYFIMGNARNLECYLRMEMLRHLQKLSVNFYNRHKTGDLMAYAVNDIGALRQSFGPGVALILNGLGTGLISVFSMVEVVHPTLTILALLPVPFIIYIIVRLGTTIRIRFRLVQKNFAVISGRIQENISGIRVIKTYVQEDDEVSRFEDLNNQMKQSNIDLVRVSSVLGPLIQVFFGISFMINLIYGSYLVKANEISLGDFVAFNGYLTMIMAPVISIGRIINVFQRGMASYRRLEEIFNVEPEIQGGTLEPSPNGTEKLEGRIEISGLSFAYPGHDEYALKDINIKLEKGQILGVIGRTGSGKTTLVNLLLKLYNVEPGKIKIDGRDINEYSLEGLRENIGYVPQDNFLFSASINDNIRYFNDQYTDEDIEDASKISMIYDNIMEFPNKFETQIGERGVNLSGGQKQRISIARAIIKRPAIYILDDALSAVDTQTEEAIINNLKKVMKGHTGIIIAHRISALKHADEIVVLDHGRIVQRGTHEELIKQDGLYRELYNEQYENERRECLDDEEAS
ncbi:MAG TPA: ABC transporter ATP-binding protein [Clostridiales bacterium]|nr:ABC transporter ATP-binding protein [Clostridiales bacterium]